jgi:hypothetical protein
LGVLSAITLVGVLYLTSYMNFFYDEWDFVTTYRPRQTISILIPHNEHWATIPILLWKLLFAVFGLRTHVPYEAAALLAHIACVVLLFALIRRRSGDLPAFAAALTLLVLGSGAKDIVWAFQVTWTLSIAFGLLAMVLIDRSPAALRPWRVIAISGALLCALMSSGIGLGFLAAVTIELLADKRRRQYLLAVIVPIAAYLIWFLAYGSALSGTPCPTCSTVFGDDVRSMGPGHITDVLAYVALALRASATGVVGLSGMAGQIALIILIVLLVWNWYVQRGVESWELGLFAGLVVQFALIALVRVRFGVPGASDSHYVYVGAVYFLPLIANAVKRLPWRGVWRVTLSGAFAIAILANAVQLIDQSMSRTDLMRLENAELRTVELFRGAPDMAMNRPLDVAIMPQLTASSYFAAVDELGSAVPNSTPDSLSNLPPYAVDREMAVLFGDALRVKAGSQQPTQGWRCQIVSSSAGTVLDVQVPDGRSVVLTASGAWEGTLSLGFLEPPSTYGRPLQIPAASTVRVQLPDTGRPVLWRLRIMSNGTADIQICSADSLQVQTGATVLTTDSFIDEAVMVPNGAPPPG